MTATRNGICIDLPTESQRRPEHISSVNILIIEDNRHMRKLLAEIVRSAFEPYAVLEAPDASSALMLCSDTRPDLVLMDVGLPDANGIELTAVIKSRFPNTKVVIVSSYNKRVYLDASRSAGAEAYIFKDEVHEKLLPALKRALRPLQGDTHPGEDS